MDLNDSYKKAAQLISEAGAIVISAGAGMGVDSGLPDFRGAEGFWKAYPMYENLGLNFMDAANPVHFDRDPAFGWGFYGHRLSLYRRTEPHKGFALLLEWIDRFKADHFVITSNVDGQFQKAGFADDRIYEVHGSIHHLQCTCSCRSQIWDNTEEISVDLDSMRARQVPMCPYCSAVARPNILMFGDYMWDGNRSYEQEYRYTDFQERNRQNPIVIIELGAGKSVPTIRMMSERMASHFKAHIIRINPRDPEVYKDNISLPCGALEGLQNIHDLLQDISK